MSVRRRNWHCLRVKPEDVPPLLNADIRKPNKFDLIFASEAALNVTIITPVKQVKNYTK